MSSVDIQSHNQFDKGHYYEDPKYPKTGYVCDDCYLEISEISLDFQRQDDYKYGTVFNTPITRSK